MEHARLGLWCGIHTVDMLISIDFRLSFFSNHKNGLNTFDMVYVFGETLRNIICVEII